MNKKIPDLVVWSEETGYDANIKPYPTNIGAPLFNMPDVSIFKSGPCKKMIDVFKREEQEIVERIKKLYDEYQTSMMVWESKISFDPVVGKSYYLYDRISGRSLSLISPDEWGSHKDFLGEFILNSDNKWIKKN